MLRPFLSLVHDDPQTAALARDGGDVFVATSLRPYLVAALADEVLAPGRPTLVVAGDDRQARDLAPDLEAGLGAAPGRFLPRPGGAPRPVRFSPSRGVAYESHLVPPPHLVGLRVAALDALLDTEAPEPPVVVVSAAALSEKVPDPALRPASFVLRKGDLLDLDETAERLVAAGYERIDQVEDRGQFAIRGGILDLYPATAERAVRVDLFDIEIESLREFSTFTQRSLAELDEVLVAPAAELAAEHRELAEIAASSDEEDRPDVAELLPLDRFRSFLDLAPADAAVLVAADEDIAPALHDHWTDVCAAFHDSDAHGLYVTPEVIEAALEERAKVRLGTISGAQPVEFRAQAADTAARSLKDAEPELEKLVRSGYRTLVTWARKGDGERVAYNLARLRAQWVSGGGVPAPELRFAVARLRDGFVATGFNLAVIPEHRLFRRRRAEPTEEEGGRRRRGALRSFADLRTGDIVVHEAHGIARFAGFDTKPVAGVTRDYLDLEFVGTDRVFMPVDQLAKISRYVGAGGAHPPLSKLGGTRWGTIKARARRAAHALPGELLTPYAEGRGRGGDAWGPDPGELVGLEARWPYRETPDQREAIES